MKKQVTMLLILLLMVTVFVIPVSAATSLEFTLTPSRETVESGDVFEVKVSVSQDKYIMGGEFYLTYDSSSFELNDVFGSSAIVYNEETPGTVFIVVANQSGIRNPLMTFEFPAKSTLVAGRSDFVFTTNKFSIADGSVGGKVYTDSFSIVNTYVEARSFGTHSELKGGDSLEFAISITKCPNSGVIYAALYKEGKLQACKYEAFTSSLTSKSFYFDNSVDYDSAKVFVWDSNGVPLLETPEDVAI